MFSVDFVKYLKLIWIFYIIKYTNTIKFKIFEMIANQGVCIDYEYFTTNLCRKCQEG